MANISDATVQISAVKCGSELLEYIKLAQDNAYYNIVGRSGELDVKEDGDTWTIEGSASGRWSYQHNASRYFPHPDNLEDLRHWVGKEKADEVEVSYRKLLDVIANNGGSVHISYGESESGALICGSGEVALIGRIDGKNSSQPFVEYSETYEALEYNAENVSSVHEADEYYDCAKCESVVCEIDKCAICRDLVCEDCEMYSCKGCNASICESCTITDSLMGNYCKSCH